jgi:hypothetical protein
MWNEKMKKDSVAHTQGNTGENKNRIPDGRRVLYGNSFTGFGKNVKHERTNAGAIQFPKKVEGRISKPGIV